jgi:hypothetical protein
LLFLLLSVKPYFLPESLGHYTVIEGDTKNLSLKAFGNPPQIDYSWSYPEDVAAERVIKRQHLLTIADAKRSDAGNYTVTARNSYGDFASTVTVLVDVRYPPA